MRNGDCKDNDSRISVAGEVAAGDNSLAVQLYKDQKGENRVGGHGTEDRNVH